MQLVDLGHTYERRAGIRPSDFVAFVEQTKVEDPSPAKVRVMTIHQAKGLQFDIVVLPELDVLPPGQARRSGRRPATSHRAHRTRLPARPAGVAAAVAARVSTII